eukprot:CAMPEP_0176432402 /NCGR_PEP_ID=MMETSP0127-20121128/15377_1 /TAXON_ID=938130 /ORGANISM="Platyophrya macrostoma, Strain WH" /LENGTH=357 /DNA_ID=CAMNT_0017814575 /DNA_START=12 /DNA_END=1085 /DNA_ORIENTATION=-
MRANILLISALVLIAFTCTLASERGTQKAAELRKMMLSSNDGIIFLSAAEYKEYVLTEPRPYDLVVFFTAYSCKFCDEVYESYKEAAAAYVEAKAIYPAKEGDNIKRSVFFAAIYYVDETKSIFQSHKIERVPDIFVTHPKYARLLTDAHREEYIKKFLLDASRSSVYVGTGKILEYVNERVARKVEHKESVLKLFYVLLILGIPFAALLRIYIKYRAFFNHPQFWLFGSYVVYFICMSGLVYCIIHGTPWTTQQNGEVQWWTSGSRNQLGLEGWVMSGSVLMTGLALLAVQYVSYVAGDSRAQRLLVFVGNLLLVWIGMNFVEDIYVKKGGWSGTGFYPPAHYIKGGLMKDQGNTI